VPPPPLPPPPAAATHAALLILDLQASGDSKDPFKNIQDPSQTRQAYSAEPGGRQVPSNEDEGVEREVKWGKNIPASAEQAKEEVKYVSDGCCKCCWVLALLQGCGWLGRHAAALSAVLLVLLPSLSAHRAAPTTRRPCAPALQAGKGLAESVEMAANVLLSKGKDAVAAAQRAMGMQSDHPQISEGSMGAAGKMEHAPPGSSTGFARWVLGSSAEMGAAALATVAGFARLSGTGCWGVTATGVLTPPACLRAETPPLPLQRAISRC
jgi:hypothetical protein